MKIILKNHTEEYTVREIVNSYFPKLKLEITDCINDKDEDEYIISEYFFENNIHTFRCKAILNSGKYETELTSDFFDKNKLKKTVSDALKKLTGIHLPWGLLTGIRPSKIVREYFENGGSDAISHLINAYETDKSKAIMAYNVERNESKYIASRYSDGISLYVGIPFCPTRCIYCSFTSQSIAFSNKLTNPYVEALKYEIEKTASMDYVRKHRIETVYFGGGTPTAVSASQIDDILCTLKANFDLTNVKEITFEAGRPDTITEEKLHILKKHGISRISINPQTVNDKTLKIIGRKHTFKDFENSFQLARKMDFGHINCDIIAGLPEEDEQDFCRTLDILEELKPESITVHTMSIKHGSNLDMMYDMYSPTAAATVNNMLSLAEKSMCTQGKIPYYMYRQKNMLGNLENIGYCDKNHECLYNIYIMEEIQSIVALGAGASTKLVHNNQIERVFNVKEVSEYIKRTDEMIQRKAMLFDSFVND